MYQNCERGLRQDNMNLKTFNSTVYWNMELATKGHSGIKEFQHWNVSVPEIYRMPRFIR